MINKIKQTAEFIRSKFQTDAIHALTLGTGLGNFTHILKNQESIPYSEIPNFPTSTVLGHEGKMIFAKINNIPVICLAGRFHYYEGYSMQEITFPIRVLKELGIENIILTNASGSLKQEIPAGSVVLIEDHINMMPEHPLRGQTDERLGNRFPDMKMPYDPTNNDTFKRIGKANNIDIYEGIYYAIQGPSLETRSECRMARLMGADIIGMSTVPEVIVATQIEMKVNAISIATNLCDPDVKGVENTTIEEVVQAAQAAEPKLSLLVEKYFEGMGKFVSY